MNDEVMNVEPDPVREILQEFGIDLSSPRVNWIPMTDATNLVVAVAWKNEEDLAWLLFAADPQGHA